MIFDYPEPREHRRHHPQGYTAYESYRPWLRDEFTFRCVYCLKRETWGQVTFEYELDHFQPQSLRADLKRNYLNLVYACRRCNAVKGDQVIDDPFRSLNSETVATSPDGSLHTRDGRTSRLIRHLDLNAPRLRAWRLMWTRIVTLAMVHEQTLYSQLVGFPIDLPDLRRLRPPKMPGVKDGTTAGLPFVNEDNCRTPIDPIVKRIPLSLLPR